MNDLRAVISVAAIALPLLVACSTTAPVSPAQVAGLETSLTIADTLAIDYTTLPACPQASNVCSDPATKAAIKKYAAAAYTAVKTVQGSRLPADMAVAEAAIAALQTAVPK